MQMLARNPAAAYRRVDLDARIEASEAGELTLICMEEAVAALGQALLALERAPGEVPREPLARAQSIALWLARSVDPQNPLSGALQQFYGGLAATIAHNMVRTKLGEVAQVREDFADLLAAAKSTQ